MKASLTVAGMAVAVIVVSVGLLVYEIAVWRECLAVNPWWYCLRVLGK